MASWFKVTRRDWTVQDAFETIWLQNGAPVRAALFCKRNARERTNEFYFTPEAAEIAQSLLERFGGIQCVTPDFSHPSLLGPVLLVGDQSILEGNG